MRENDNLEPRSDRMRRAGELLDRTRRYGEEGKSSSPARDREYTDRLQNHQASAEPRNQRIRAAAMKRHCRGRA